MARLVWTLPDGQQTARWAEDEGGGSGGHTTVGFDAATDPDTFLSPAHVFDLGSGSHSVLLTLTAIALVGDGETFGNDSGEIFATIAADDGFPGAVTNGDGGGNYTAVAAKKDVSNFIAGPNEFIFELQADDQVADQICLSARYLRVQLGIYSNDTGELYAGANNPTAHAMISATYL